MEEKYLDLVLVPLSLVVMVGYHLWLLFTINYYPKRTVHGLNAHARERWVATMMVDPLKHRLAVQTLQNNIQASTVLATTAITLLSLISVFVGATSSTSSSFSVLVYGNKSTMVASIKFVAISLCFIIAFICNVQSIRYYTQTSFLLSIPAARGATDTDTTVYLATGLNRGNYFWSFGLRTFYLSITLFMWIFGPIFMLVVTVVICGMCYLFDTTSDYTRRMHKKFHGGDNNPDGGDNNLDNHQCQPLLGYNN